jgi:hypothetical protein
VKKNPKIFIEHYKPKKRCEIFFQPNNQTMKRKKNDVKSIFFHFKKNKKSGIVTILMMWEFHKSS